MLLLPFLLYRLIRRLDVKWDVEPLINIPTTMLVGIVLVVFAFNLAAPISNLSSTVTRSTLGIAMASVMLSFLMMITRRKAIPQVIGFLAMENGLFFAATSATYGMPMVVELGIALDVLVGMLILGVFFFQIREQFDSLDLKHLEKLKEDRVIEILLVLGIPLGGGLVLAAIGERESRPASTSSPACSRSSPRWRSPPASPATARCSSSSSSSSSIRSTSSWSR